MSRPARLLACLTLVACAHTVAPQASATPAATRVTVDTPEALVLEVVLDADVERVWRLFTTDDGIRASYGVPRAAVDLRVGGSVRTSYDPASTLDDDATIEQEILAYDPPRMIATRLVRDGGSGFLQATAGTWSVTYFEPVGPDRTRLRMVGLGYGDDPAAQKVRGFFRDANPGVLDALARALREGRL